MDLDRRQCVGFAICFLALIALQHTPSMPLLYLMVLAQGFLGYGVTSIIGAVAIEIFEGKHFGSIYGTLTLAGAGGRRRGSMDHRRDPRPDRQLRDSRSGSASCVCAVSILAIWMAGPRKIRAVAGQMHRVKLRHSWVG